MKNSILLNHIKKIELLSSKLHAIQLQIEQTVNLTLKLLLYFNYYSLETKLMYFFP